MAFASCYEQLMVLRRSLFVRPPEGACQYPVVPSRLTGVFHLVNFFRISVLRSVSAEPLQYKV